MKTKLIFSALLFVAGVATTQAQVSQWVAYNDHIRGAGTSPNVTSWNIFGTAQSQAGSNGFLLNSASGATLPVAMVCSNITNGVQGGTGAGAPAAGTPAGTMFAGFVDFGTGTSNHAVQLGNSTTVPSAAKIVHAFSGLDPTKRYSWHGTAVRGNNYVDRWTLLEIGAASWQDAHTVTSTGVFTSVQIPGLPASQAVANFGENRALGVVAGWTNIEPNADGTLYIYMSTYRGTMPAGFSTGTAYGYAVVADRLEEFSVGGDTFITITTNPNSTNVAEHSTATFTVAATGAPKAYYWRKNGVPIPGANSATYTTPPVSSLDNGAVFTCMVSNAVNSPVSSGATLSVTPDTVRPVALAAIGSTNGNEVTISFSEALAPGSVTPSAFAVFPTGGSPGASVASAVLTNGTNVIVSAPLTPGQNYSVRITGVTDNAGTPNVLQPNPTTLPVAQTVVLFAFDKVWKYNQTGADLGTTWKESVYDDSTWLSGAGVLGFETSANTLTFLRSIAPPNGTNTVLSLTNNTGGGMGGTNITFYFRTTVNIPNFNPASAVMTLRAYIDDGAILYINGVEQFRYNLTNGPGYLKLANAALTEPNPLPQTTFVVSNLTGFVQGDNVIAVEVHQDAMSSSDIDWGMQLEARVTNFAPAGPRITVVPNGSSITLTWPGGGTLQRSTDIGSPANWVSIPGATSPFVTNTSGALKFFRVTVP